MTEKQDFLEKLHAALTERDISETDIQPYIERFDRFYDRMVNDPEHSRADLLEDVEQIADNIAEQVSERYDDINRLAERTLTIDRVDASGNKPEAEASAPESAEPSGDGVQEGEVPDATIPISVLPEEAQSYEQLPMDEPPDKHAKKLPEYIDEEPSPNSTIFWVLFAVSLPVTIPLALAVIALFVFVWGGLAALILGSIAVLIAAVAGGTALSLVGIIYGVTKLFSEVPIGLYEIGLGVLIGACVMFAGILLYNFAVRLLPLLIKLVARLFRYLYGRLRLLFGFLRRECAKL